MCKAPNPPYLNMDQRIATISSSGVWGMIFPVSEKFLVRLKRELDKNKSVRIYLYISMWKTLCVTLDG